MKKLLLLCLMSVIGCQLSAAARVAGLLRPALLGKSAMVVAPVAVAARYMSNKPLGFSTSSFFGKDDTIFVPLKDKNGKHRTELTADQRNFNQCVVMMYNYMPPYTRFIDEIDSLVKKGCLSPREAARAKTERNRKDAEQLMMRRYNYEQFVKDFAAKASAEEKEVIKIVNAKLDTVAQRVNDLLTPIE